MVAVRLVLLGLLMSLQSFRPSAAKNVPASTNVNQDGKKVSKEDADCPAYAYCAGENFPSRIMVKDYVIHCVQEEEVRDRCCLPSSKHLVCYDITVEGDQLNFSNDTMLTTDFTSLCKEMVESADMVHSKYQSAALKAGGGNTIFLYDQWVTGIQSVEADVHIRHLACGIE